MKSKANIGVIVNADNCNKYNFDLTASIGDVGSPIFLYVDGLSNLSPLWDTWTWQYSINHEFGIGSTWVDDQIGGLQYVINTDDTSVRIKFSDSTCDYYSNVSGFRNDLYTNPTHAITVIQSALTIARTTSYVKIDLGAALWALAKNITLDTVNDNFTTTKSGIYLANISLVLTDIDGASDYTVALFIDGVESTASSFTVNCNANKIGTASVSYHLNQNIASSTYDVRIKSSATSGDVIINRAFISLTRIGDKY